MMFEPIGHPLQQQVADVATETVVDIAEMHDVEGHDGRRALGAFPPLEEGIEPLTEQRALRQPGQLIEVRQKLGVMLLLAILQPERERRQHVLEQQQLFVPEKVALARGKGKNADAGTIDTQRQRHHRFEPRADQLLAPRNLRLRLREVGTVRDLTRAQRTADETRIRLGPVTDRKFPPLGRHWPGNVPGAVPRHRATPIERNHDHHRAVVAAHLQSQTAGLPQQLVSVPDPDDGGVDRTLQL